MAKLSFEIFIAGSSMRNHQLIELFEGACNATLPATSFDISIIDLSQDVHLAEQHKILATPTILRKWPGPEKRIIGNLNSDAALQAVYFLTEDLKSLQHEKHKRD